jgi:hypothetical protein
MTAPFFFKQDPYGGAWLASAMIQGINVALRPQPHEPGRSFVRLAIDAVIIKHKHKRDLFAS